MKKTSRVTEEEAEVRLDKVLASKNPDNSRQEVQSWIKDGHVKVNELLKKANYKVKLLDEITWSIPEAIVRKIEAENIPLTIIYEDDTIIVINKERGMLVHPTVQENSGTLVNALLYYSNALSNTNGDERPGIVHRLDKDTSGIMVIAKTNEAYVHLQKQFVTHTVHRKYEAVVFGVVNHDHGIIDAPIGRDPQNRLRMAVTSSGRHAETQFDVLERFTQHSYVACELITGRTHQIRVHMKYMNHPIIGDPVYSRKKSKLLASQALFAKELKFIHPVTEEQLSFEIEQPAYIQNLLNQLRKMT